MRSRTLLAEITHGLYTTVVCAFAVICTYGFLYDLSRLKIKDDVIVTGIELFFVLMLWCVVFFEVRSFGSRLFIDDDGIGVKRYKSIKVYLKWSEICETGVGYIPTPFGNKKRIFLSAKHLTDEQKRDLLTLKYETVHFSYIPKGWTEIIFKNCITLKGQNYEEMKKWEGI